MLDQNTDRMWFVIGALIVGAGVILIANKTMPEIFANIAETFYSASESFTEMRWDGITTNFVVRGETKQSYSPTYNNPAPFVHKSSFKVGSEVIHLNSPLRSTGAAYDKVFYDTEDDLWKIERVTNVAEFGADRNMSFNGQIYFHRISDKKYASRYLTSHFGGGGESPWLKVDTGRNLLGETVEGNRSEYILVGVIPDFSVFPTLEYFNTWLVNQSAQGHPLQIVYELREPVYEILSQETQDTLNSYLD